MQRQASNWYVGQRAARRRTGSCDCGGSNSASSGPLLIYSRDNTGDSFLEHQPCFGDNIDELCELMSICFVGNNEVSFRLTSSCFSDDIGDLFPVLRLCGEYRIELCSSRAKKEFRHSAVRQSS